MPQSRALSHSNKLKSGNSHTSPNSLPLQPNQAKPHPLVPLQALTSLIFSLCSEVLPCCHWSGCGGSSCTWPCVSCPRCAGFWAAWPSPAAASPSAAPACAGCSAASAPFPADTQGSEGHAHLPPHSPGNTDSHRAGLGKAWEWLVVGNIKGKKVFRKL